MLTIFKLKEYFGGGGGGGGSSGGGGDGGIRKARLNKVKV